MGCSIFTIDAFNSLYFQIGECFEIVECLFTRVYLIYLGLIEFHCRNSRDTHTKTENNETLARLIRKIREDNKK